MMLATPGLTWAQQVEVNVEGDYPQLQDNAEAFLGEVEGRSALDDTPAPPKHKWKRRSVRWATTAR